MNLFKLVKYKILKIFNKYIYKDLIEKYNNKCPVMLSSSIQAALDNPYGKSKKAGEELFFDYEKETGSVIVETFKGTDPMTIPAVVVHSHGPFAWGTDPHNAVHNAVVLEELAIMAFNTKMLSPDISEMQSELLDKHYQRKHGKNAYYGQK